jgi:hypothetical protein
MLQSIIEGVEETSCPVLSVDYVQTRCVGFCMEQLKGDNVHSWEWEIKTDDLNRCLETPEWQHLDNGGANPEWAVGFRTARGRARIAAILSEGKLP